jgi:GNAT superfamily N-acetyltransferase
MPPEIDIIVPDWSLDSVRTMAPLVAELVYESFPEFYELVSDNRADVVACISEQLRNPASEIGINRVLLVDRDVAGIYTYIPSGEASLRRMIGFRSLLRVPSAKPDAGTRAAEFGRGIEPVPGGEALWTRLATASRFRGRGLGLRMSHALIDEVSKAGFRQLFSHVHRENAASLALHERLGFEPLGGYGYTHIALARALP